MTAQPELDFNPPDPRQARQDEILSKFNEWKETGGGNYVLQELYRIASPFAARYKATGQVVSIKYLFEKLRDHIVTYKMAEAKRGHIIKKSDGYSLNNTFSSVVARHIVDRRKDWVGMFETRERTVEREQE